MKSKVVFTASFADGTIMEFYAPQTWRNVFSICKDYANTNKTSGKIYCNGVFVRKVGAC